jgi:hypothetical protein
MGGRKTFDGDAFAWAKAHADFKGDECLRWPFGISLRGYGNFFSANGEIYSPHRYMCELAHGKPPTPKHDAAHNCGKGHLGCVNPRHLEWKTSKENAADKLVHGTRARGSRHGMAKLTEANVKCIRRLLKTGLLTKVSIAKRFNVTPEAINRIVREKIWRHVGNDSGVATWI